MGGLGPSAAQGPRTASTQREQGLRVAAMWVAAAWAWACTVCAHYPGLQCSTVEWRGSELSGVCV